MRNQQKDLQQKFLRQQHDRIRRFQKEAAESRAAQEAREARAMEDMRDMPGT